MAYGSGRDALVRAAIEIAAEKGIQGLPTGRLRPVQV